MGNFFHLNFKKSTHKRPNICSFSVLESNISLPGASKSQVVKHAPLLVVKHAPLLVSSRPCFAIWPPLTNDSGVLISVFVITLLTAIVD